MKDHALRLLHYIAEMLQRRSNSPPVGDNGLRLMVCPAGDRQFVCASYAWGDATLYLNDGVRATLSIEGNSCSSASISFPSLDHAEDFAITLLEQSAKLRSQVEVKAA